MSRPAWLLTITGLLAMLAAGIVLGISYGAADISNLAVVKSLIGQSPDPLTYHIVVSRRLPRVMVAALAGAGLALCGAVLQSLSHNPLADPYILGISGGAMLGAAAVITGGLTVGTIAGFNGVALAAFIGSIVSLALVFLFSTNSQGNLEPSRMILAGVAIGQITGAAASAFVYFGDRDAAQRIQTWALGSLSGIQWPGIPITAVAVVALFISVMMCSRALDAFSFGTDFAQSLGVDVRVIRWFLYALVSFVTATIVAEAGMIGFVGLIVPHIVRFVFGPIHGLLLPFTGLVGAIFLVWVDLASRTIFNPREIPLGLITAIVGVPVFLFILHRNRKGVSV